MMKVILLKDVERLGNVGEIVNVADGFARNYLIPNSFAMEAKKSNIKLFENQKISRDLKKIKMLSL